jgi:PST family polysaccharide transporter
VRATAITLANQTAGFLLRLASGVVLARLLTPADYGLVGMVTVVTSFVALFNDLGLSMATVQKAELTHLEVNALFWINVGVSFFLASVVSCLSPAIAWFYGEPRLIPVAVALASCLAIGGTRVQHAALLRRQMRFGALAIIDITSAILGIIAGIALAITWRDYWALVAMHVISTVAACCGTWFFSTWRPTWPRALFNVGHQLRFGTQFTASQVLYFVTRNLDGILIGRYFGPRPLGLYSRAYQLMLLPMQQITLPITMVAIPALSCLQSEPHRYRRYYCKALTLMAYFTMPLTITAFVFSDEIIGILLGPKWLDASAIFRLLALAALIEPFAVAASWLLISAGRAHRLLLWTFVQTMVMALLFVLGISWGVRGVAISYVSGSYALLIPWFVVALKDSPIAFADLRSALWRPSVLTALMCGAMEGVHYLLKSSHAITLLSIPFSCIAVYILVILVWPSARTEVADFVTAAWSIWRRPKSVEWADFGEQDHITEGATSLAQVVSH